MPGESSDEGGESNVAGEQAVVVFQPQEWIDGRAVPARDSVTFLVPATDATDDEGDLVADDSYESDELAGHPNAPEWVKEWDGPFFVTVTDIVEGDRPGLPATEVLFEVEPESTVQRSCDGCNYATYDRYLLAADKEAAASERAFYEEEDRNGLCSDCIMGLLMGTGLFSHADGKREIQLRE